MDPLYWLLWLCYGGMLLLSLRLSGWRFSPAVAFFFTWSASLGLLAIGSLSLEFSAVPLPTSAFRYLLLAGCAFLAGVVLAHVIRPDGGAGGEAGEGSDASGESQAEVGAFHLPALKALAASALVFTALTILRDAPDLRAYLADGGAIRDELTDPTGGRSSILGALAIYSALSVVPVASAYWLYSRTVRWWMVGPTVAAALLALLAIGKFVLIFLGLTFLNAWFYHRSDVRPASATKRAGAGPVAIVLAVLLGAFWVTTELRGRAESGAERALPNGFLGVLYVYANGYVPAFGEFYQEHADGFLSTAPTSSDYDASATRLGNQTFSGIYRFLAQVGLARYSASNRYEGVFNVYTIYRDLIMDFGVPGSVVFIFLVGLGVTLLHNAIAGRGARALILLSLVTTQMEFSLIYSLFGFAFYPVILLVSPLLARPPAPLVETREAGLAKGGTG